MPNDKLKKLYDTVGKEYNLPDYATFQSDMADEGKRKKFYETVATSYDLPDYTVFSTDMGFGEPPGKSVPDGSGVPSGGSQMPSGGQQQGSRAFDPLSRHREASQKELQNPMRTIPKVIEPTFEEQSNVDTSVQQSIVDRKAEIEATPEAKEFTRKEKEYRALKPVADQFRNLSGNRSKEFDIPALQSEYEKAGGLNKLRVEEQLDRAYRAVDEDYLDVLAATKPEVYQENKNRLDAIEAKKKAGETLSDADEKFEVEFRNKAISAAGAAEKANIYEIQRNFNFEEYQKQTAELTIEAENYRKEYDALLDKIGQRPPTPQEKVRMDELLKKSESVAKRYVAAEENTGVTPEVRSALEGSYQKLASLGIAFDQNESRHGAGLKKDIAELRKEQRAEELKTGNPLVAIDEFMRATSGAVSSGVQSIAQVPKVLGDLVGDSDYDWADKMYDFSKNVKEETESEFGRVAGFENMPTWMKIPTYLGEGVGSVTMLGAGGATMGGGRLATMGAAFLTSEADYYQAALDAGASPQEAAQQATAIATVTSALEGIIPDSKYFEPTAFRKSVLKEVASGKTFKESLKSKLNEFIPVALEYSQNVGKGAVKEAGEEGLQQFGEDVTKETINTIAGKEYYTDTFNPATYKEAMLIGGLTGGVFNAVNSLREKSPTQEGQLFDAAGDRENIVSKISQIDETRAAEVDALLTEAEKMKKGWERIPQFQKLSPEKQAHVVSESLRAKQLNKTSKEVGMADEATDLEVKAIEEEVAGIVRTGKTSTEIAEDEKRIAAEEERIKVEKEQEEKIAAELEAQPEVLTEAEIKVKESLGEKIYTPEDIDLMMQEDEVIEKCPPGYVQTAENGAKTGFKPGGKWEIVTEFKGKSHKEGGIDIEIVGGNIKYSDEDGGIKLANGGFWNVFGSQLKQLPKFIASAGQTGLEVYSGNFSNVDDRLKQQMGNLQDAAGMTPQAAEVPPMAIPEGPSAMDQMNMQLAQELASINGVNYGMDINGNIVPV